MGMPGPFPRGCRTNRQQSAPNPSRFTFISGTSLTGSNGKCALVMEVHYPDCTNFEGRKILVYEGVRSSDVLTWDRVDPHFAESGGPIARFRPTRRGKQLALDFAERLVAL